MLAAALGSGMLFIFEYTSGSTLIETIRVMGMLLLITYLGNYAITGKSNLFFRNR